MKSIGIAMYGAGCVLSMAMATPARAAVDLDVWFTNVSCTQTQAGVTFDVGCSGDGLTSIGVSGDLYQIGDEVRVSGTLNYEYHDDGLPLLEPVCVQTSLSGYANCSSFEAGVIRVHTRNSAVESRPVSYSGTLDLTSIFLGGADANPDSRSGSIDVYAAATFWTLTPGATLPFNGSTGIGVEELVFAAPVPEPSSYALMLAGLGAVGLVARRRKKLTA